MDGGDADARHRVQLVRGQVLDVVEFSELATIVWGDVLLELLECLTAEVSPIDEKKYTAAVGELDEPVDGSNSSNRFAAPGRHLDQGARAVVNQGAFEVLDGDNLRR